MKKMLLLIPIAFILFAGCDILDHDPYNNDKIDSFFDNFSSAFQSITAEDVTAVMDFYDEDYFHDLNDYYAREEFYLQLFQDYGNDLELQTSLLDYNENLMIEWLLTVNYSVNDTNYTEAFSFEEQLIDREGEYLFYGNQVNPPELDPSKPVIFVEYGTAESCGNCPPASAMLHEMGLEHGGQFIYVSYCAGEPMDIYIDFASYYNEMAQPVTIFGGKYKVVGASSEDLDEFGQRYNQILAGTPEAFLNNISWTDNGEMIDGTVDVDLQGIQTANLYLRAALVDERPELFYVSGGARIYNVLFALGEEEISDSGTAEFRISYDLPSYANEMPAHTKLVLWLQTREQTYNPDTCKVHTAAQVKLF